MLALTALILSSYPKALSLLDRGEFSAALSVIDSALRDDPSDTLLRELRVRALLGLGKTDQAFRLALSLGKEINTQDEFSRLFYIFKYAGHEEEGIKLLVEGRKSLRDNKAFAREIYSYYISKGETEKALPELFSCSADLRLRYWLSDEIRNLSTRNPNALERLSDWMIENPHPEWLEALCYELALKQGLWETAGRWAGGDENLMDVAERAISEGNIAEAERLLAQVKTRGDRYHALRGDCLSARGRYSEAESAYSAINDRTTRETRLSGLYLGAYNQPERVIGLSGNAPEKAEALMRAGKFSEALGLASEMEPPDRLYYSGKAGLFLGQDWATDSLKKFVALYSRDERATSALAWLEICASSEGWPSYFQALHQLEKGSYEAVLSSQPEDTALAGYFGVLRARALEGSGRIEDALALYAKLADAGGLPGAEAAFRAWRLCLNLKRESEARGFMMILVRKYPRTPYGIIAREYVP
ncbi:MAG: tetratricopeptide repeat protein [candidate division WOR-3 bacterium]